VIGVGGLIDNAIVAATDRWVAEKSTPLKTIKIIQPGSNKLCVLLPPWHIVTPLWNHLQERLIKRGYSLLIYEASEDILSADGKHIQTKFKEIKDKAVKDIHDLQKQHTFKTIDVVGLSLGTCSALYVAISGITINNLVLVCPSEDLAEGIWTGIHTQKIRAQLEKDKKTLDDFRAEMKVMTMRRDYKMNVKNVEILVSDADKVIPYNLGLDLAKSLQAKGISTKVRRYRHRGHYATVILFCLFGKLAQGVS